MHVAPSPETAAGDRRLLKRSETCGQPKAVLARKAPANRRAGMMVGQAAGVAVRAPHVAAPCRLRKVHHSLSLGNRRLPAGSCADCSWAHIQKVSETSTLCTTSTCLTPLWRTVMQHGWRVAMPVGQQHRWCRVRNVAVQHIIPHAQMQCKY